MRNPKDGKPWARGDACCTSCSPLNPVALDEDRVFRLPCLGCGYATSFRYPKLPTAQPSSPPNEVWVAPSAPPPSWLARVSDGAPGCVLLVGATALVWLAGLAVMVLW